MESKYYEKIIEMIMEKLERAETHACILEYDNKRLAEEVARLNELLNPTKKGDIKDE